MDYFNNEATVFGSVLLQSITKLIRGGGVQGGFPVTYSGQKQMQTKLLHQFYLKPFLQQYKRKLTQQQGLAGLRNEGFTVLDIERVFYSFYHFSTKLCQ